MYPRKISFSFSSLSVSRLSVSPSAFYPLIKFSPWARSTHEMQVALENVSNFPPIPPSKHNRCVFKPALPEWTVPTDPVCTPVCASLQRNLLSNKCVCVCVCVFIAYVECNVRMARSSALRQSCVASLSICHDNIILKLKFVLIKIKITPTNEPSGGTPFIYYDPRSG